MFIPALAEGKRLRCEVLALDKLYSPFREIGRVGHKAKNFGWGTVNVCDNGVARRWFGEDPQFLSFHWHGETFSIPPGATRVLENAHCANQAFALGKHLGMQTHIEMTEDLIRHFAPDLLASNLGIHEPVVIRFEAARELGLAAA